MKRRILLLEPNYRNKYPPMGLMKLAMYHRLQGDHVVFYKGDLRTFVLNQITEETIAKLYTQEPELDWSKFTPQIKKFIRLGKIEIDSDFEEISQRNFILKWLAHGRREYRTGSYFKTYRWDRVCVTTLFTFEWDITIETIKFAQKLCNDVFVGGILASVMPEKIERETGIKPYVGSILEKKLGDDTPLDRKIDELPLDYSILEEIEYRYPATDAYYSYATRGCTNSCKFCAVPILEPGPMTYAKLKPRIQEAQDHFGEHRHLLLMDNNVFASAEFGNIIDEISELGFGRGATYTAPNLLAVAIKQLQNGWNDRAYIRMAVRLIYEWLDKLEGEKYNELYSILKYNNLLHDYTATKKNIIAVYNKIRDDYSNSLSKRPLSRYVDFNQGMDARLATQSNMRKLAQINIRPLRIALDSWKDRVHYVKAIKLASTSGITQMSNYLLYNYLDDPVELYLRLLLNIDLCDKEEALGVNIYSFPMKYHPIMDKKWFSNRNYIGPKWTRKSIRAVQAILNSTRGKIGRGRTFFFKAFGRNESEFNDLLKMPEVFIIRRWDAEINGFTDRWRDALSALNNSERVFVDKIVAENNFEEEVYKQGSLAIQKTLSFYKLNYKDIPPASDNIKKKKIKEFEGTCPKKISKECRHLLEVT